MSNNIAIESSNLLPVLGTQPFAKPNYNYFPLLSGDTFPAFHFSSEAFITLKDRALLPEKENHLQDWLDYPQPLVIAFWSVTGKVDNVEEWKSLQADIQIMGGRLLIITNGTSKHFTHKIRKENSLNILEDRDQLYAEEAGLYDTQNPLADWLSGVEEDIALPAFYLIGKDKSILFHHIDYSLKTVNGNHFSESPFVRNLLTAVYKASGERSSLLQKAIS